MRENSKQWITMGPAATEHEERALAEVRRLLPEVNTTWAWTNLTFLSRDGRTSEVDLILLLHNGLYVLELKGWHGHITGDQQHWRVTDPNGKVRSEPNPLFANERKAKRLKSLLSEDWSRQRGPVPFVRAITVLHGRDSRIDLPEIARADTYGLDGYQVSGLPALSELIRQEPAGGNQITPKLATHIRKAMNRAGFKARPKTLKVGHYELIDADPLAEGPGWVDRRAKHPMLPGQYRRIRLYGYPPKASASQRAEILNAAKREELFTRGLDHPGIVRPQELLDSEVGPVLVFPDDSSSLPLPEYLAQHRDQLSLRDRLELIRLVGEVLAYAHKHQVHHRGLTPGDVHVRSGSDEHHPQVTVRDWQTGQQDVSETISLTMQGVLGGPTSVAGLVPDRDQVYLAPEVRGAHAPDPVALDVYGLGALAYLVLTLAAPAANLAELQQRLVEGGLDPAVQQDDLPEELTLLVEQATYPDVAQRIQSVQEFLDELTAVERQLAEQSEPHPDIDPLEAQPTDILGNDLMVEQRLGSGATGIAFLVSDESDAEPTVLKVAHDAERAERLVREADVLARLDSPRVVRLLRGPYELGGRTVIEVADAGRPTLGSRISTEGRLTVEQLENYGRDLFEVADYMESQGVTHRDIKPDNLGVRPDPASRRPRLVLFDFSLVNEPADRIDAGTRGYLDPFLGTPRRPNYDSAAERFAVAATLFNMATGQLPHWGDGRSAPPLIEDEVSLDPALFEEQAAEPLAEFFSRALARDVVDRFPDLTAMAAAWEQVFQNLQTGSGQAGQAGQTDADRESAAAAAQLTTPLARAGLTPRAISAMDRISVTTVAELLGLDPVEINQLPGVGVEVRKELQARRRDWLRLQPEAEPVAAPTGRSLELVTASLVPRANGKNTDSIAVAKRMVEPGGTGWSTWAEVGAELGLSAGQLERAQQQLLDYWQDREPVDELRLEILELLEQNQGLATVFEVADRLAALRGSRRSGSARRELALGVVRVAVETELAAGQDLLVSRPRDGQAILLALVSSGEADESNRMDAVRALARVVDDAVSPQQAPLRAIRSLALVREHPAAGTAGIADPSRLLALAAATGEKAAVSGRGELYARGLHPAEAVRAVLAGLVGRRVVSGAWLRTTVSVRFPLAEPLPDRPELDRIVTAARSDLHWDGSNYVRAVTESGTGHSATGQLTSLHPGSSRPDQVDRQLRASLASSAALVLTAPVRRAASLPRVLADRYEMLSVNLTGELLRSMHQVADRLGADWQVVLAADAAPAGSPDRKRLASLVSQALAPVWQDLMAQEQPLLLTDLEPLALYGQLDRLAELLDLASARPAARWLLVPTVQSGTPPTLAGQPVPLGAEGWLELPRDLAVPPDGFRVRAG